MERSISNVVGIEKKAILLTILMLCVAVGQICDATQNNMISGGISVGIMVLALVVPQNYTAPLVLFLMFAMSTISLAGISVSTLITVVVCLKEWLLQNERIKTVDAGYLIIFVLIEFSKLISNRYDIIGALIKLWFLAMFFKLIFLNDDKGVGFYKTNHFFMLMGFISLAVSGFLFNRSLLHKTRFALTSAIGVNMTGIFCGMIFCFGIINLTNRCISFKNKLVSFVAFALALIVGILTASRTFFAMVAATLIIMVFAKVRKPKKFVRNLCVLIFLLIAAWVVIHYSSFLKQEFSYMINRIIKPKDNDLSNGRIYIWNLYFNKIFESFTNFLFGFSSTRNGIDYVAHNAFIEQFCEYGFVGNIFVVSFFIHVLRDIRSFAKHRSMKACLPDDRKLFMLPVFLILLSGMVSHSLLAMPKTMFIFYSMYLFYSYKYRDTVNLR